MFLLFSADNLETSLLVNTQDEIARIRKRKRGGNMWRKHVSIMFT